MLIRVQGPTGQALDARVEVVGNVVVLHSRSGGGAAARNAEYRPALEMILGRLAEAGADPDVFLDSRPVQHLPLSNRRLATGAALTGTVEQQFNELVRAMNAGSASNGAYSRLRLQVPGISAERLAQIIRGGTQSARQVERLSYDQLRRVGPKQVERAVQMLRCGEPHNFASSRDFDLLTAEGERFPPKAVFGLAIREALGIEAFPGHFSAGLGTPCFEILQEAGYEVVPKGGQRSPDAQPGHHSAVELRHALADMPVTEEERAWIEGNPNVGTHLRRERAPGLAKAKKEAFLAEHGRLFCERCALDPTAE